jgi:hypothetical protein
VEVTAAGQNRRNHLRGGKQGSLDDTVELLEPRRFSCGLLWWQIRGVESRRSVRCASRGFKSGIPVKKAYDLFPEIGCLAEWSAVRGSRKTVIPAGDLKR